MIRIICVGKEKEPYFIQAAQDYLKRITKYSKIEVIQLPEYKLYDSSPSNIEKALTEEAKSIYPHLKGTIVALDSRGEELTSEEFAGFIKTHISPDITFIIGSSIGLSAEVKKSAHKVVSFGKMTYPHRLMRVILLEQIYRAFCIINNTPYHK
ncbi:MAG TPA: 23S rRNA (pseudouridine(1915)-N(3))-methyltransferase RlmH [Clostridia bacterium]